MAVDGRFRWRVIVVFLSVFTHFILVVMLKCRWMFTQAYGGVKKESLDR